MLNPSLEIIEMFTSKDLICGKAFPILNCQLNRWFTNSGIDIE